MRKVKRLLSKPERSRIGPQLHHLQGCFDKKHKAICNSLSRVKRAKQPRVTLNPSRAAAAHLEHVRPDVIAKHIGLRAHGSECRQNTGRNRRQVVQQRRSVHLGRRMQTRKPSPGKKIPQHRRLHGVEEGQRLQGPCFFSCYRSGWLNLRLSIPARKRWRRCGRALSHFDQGSNQNRRARGKLRSPDTQELR